MFGDYIDEFLGNRRSQERFNDKLMINKDVYENLKEKAENFELLAKEYKKIKSKNDELLKEIEELKDDNEKFKELQEEKEKYYNSLLRVRADFENYKKRTERDNVNFRQYATENILKKLIKHLDDLDRALKVLEALEVDESIKEGFEIIVKNFGKLLKEEGVEPINCEGQKFDPYKHEALIVEENDNDLPEGIILEELDKGYYFNNKVLRPAKVKLSKKRNLQNLEEKQGE